MSIRIRVGAILIKNGEILLVNHQKEGDSYWLLPGGGLEETETLDAAIVREVKEELSLEVETQELLFVFESISPQKRHILHISFLVKIINGEVRVEKDYRLKDARFFSTAELNNLKIYPNIKKEISDIILNKGEYQGKQYLGNRFHD